MKIWLWARVKSCVLQFLLFTPPFRLTVVPLDSSAVRHVVALLDSWSIHMFTDHAVVLQTRAKSCWCCISCAVTQDYFGGCCCGWVGLARRQLGERWSENTLPERMKNLNLNLRACVTVTTSRSSLLNQNLLSNQPSHSHSVSRDHCCYVLKRKRWKFFIYDATLAYCILLETLLL